MPSAASIDARGALNGGLIGASFGLVFVLVNSSELGAWTVAIRIAGVIATVVIVADLFRRLGPGSTTAGTATLDRAPYVAAGNTARLTPSTPWSRGYWLIVALEAVALFGGVQLIVRVLEAPRYAIAWVAFVVGAHFFGLAALWRVARFVVLGVVLDALAAVALVIGLTSDSDAAIRLVAGVGSGVVLLVFAATAGRRGPAAAITDRVSHPVAAGPGPSSH